MAAELDCHQHAQPLGQLAAGESWIERFLAQPCQRLLKARVSHIYTGLQRALVPVPAETGCLFEKAALEEAAHQPDGPARGAGVQMNVRRGEYDLADIGKTAAAPFQREAGLRKAVWR